jgi:hypothetical protein
VLVGDGHVVHVVRRQEDVVRTGDVPCEDEVDQILRYPPLLRRSDPAVPSTSLQRLGRPPPLPPPGTPPALTRLCSSPSSHPFPSHGRHPRRVICRRGGGIGHLAPGVLLDQWFGDFRSRGA